MLKILKANLLLIIASMIIGSITTGILIWFTRPAFTPFNPPVHDVSSPGALVALVLAALFFVMAERSRKQKS
jgi:hypothetical protein